MSNFGFGFGPAGGWPDRPGGSGNDPDDIAGKIPLFAELQRLLTSSSGPVNWDLARQLAISTLSGSHHSLSGDERREVVDALRLADLWLDEVTDLPSGITAAEAWSPIDWVEKTMPAWATLCDPVAGRVVSAMGSSLPPEVAAQAGPMAPMMSQLGGLMFGAQLGQGLGGLAAEVVSGSEIGIPLTSGGVAALVPVNVAAFANSLGLPLSDVRLFLALREAAHQRLFGHVPWLRQQLVDAVDAYGRGIHIDPEAIGQAMTSIDPTNPESLQNALSGGLFEPQETEAQKAALARLERLLALVEGWVDVVTRSVASEKMGHTDALVEAVSNRRAQGGPAEQTFSTLVGLELRPRRLREAATLFSAYTATKGVSERDRLWSHPDLMPSADDLDDPLGFVTRAGGDVDFSDMMTELLGGATDDPDGKGEQKS